MLGVGLGLTQGLHPLAGFPFASLFADGGKGALCNSATSAANYETTAGITQSAFGQPVGLVLDEKTGLALGPELYSGGAAAGTTGYQTFDPETRAWELFRDAGGSGGVNLTTAEPNKAYRVSLTMAQRGGDNRAVDVRLGTGPGVGYSVLTTNAPPGDYSFVVYTVGFISNITLSLPNVGFGGIYSNFSVREIPGAHLSQAVAADRPVRVQVGGVAGYQFNGVNHRLEGNAEARDILKGAPGVTFICAFRPASLAANQYLFSTSTDGAALRLGVLVNAAGRLAVGYRRLNSDAATFVDASSGGSVVGQTKILTVTADFLNGGAGALVLRENGQQVGVASISGTGNFSDTASLSARVGALVGDSLFTYGQLFREIVLLPRVLTASELSAAEARLASLTGVTL